MDYRIETELSLPPEIYNHKIRPQTLELLGIDKKNPQNILLLGELAIIGAKFGNNWFVTACPISQPEQILGEIWCDENTNRNQVIPTADQWIRESRASAWVPAKAVETYVPEEFRPYEVHGIILVRGHELPKDQIAPTKNQESTQIPNSKPRTLRKKILNIFKLNH